MHVGGRAEKSALTGREREICAAIGAVLTERGLIFVGIDVIGDYLTEITVPSPTGIQGIARYDRSNVAALICAANAGLCANGADRTSAGKGRGVAVSVDVSVGVVLKKK